MSNPSQGVAEHGHENQQVDELWKKSEENLIIRSLREGKGFQDIADAMPELKEAFREVAGVCGCSDGRIHDHRLARAGQGILVGAKATIESFKALDAKGKIGKKLEITSHAGCGAAKIVCDQLKSEGRLPADFDPDQLGVDFAKELYEAAKAAFPDKDVTYRHIEAREMDEFHGERVIYFDATGQINPQAVSGMPMGFVFTHLERVADEITKKELGALCGIALGDHGFGKRFSADNPFRIIVSAESIGKLEVLVSLAKKVAVPFEGRVAVDGFVV